MNSYKILFHTGTQGSSSKPREEDGNKRSTPDTQGKKKKKPTQGTQKIQIEGNQVRNKSNIIIVIVSCLI